MLGMVDQYFLLTDEKSVCSLTKWKKVVSLVADKLKASDTVVIASTACWRASSCTNELPVATLEREFKVIGSSD